MIFLGHLLTCSQHRSHTIQLFPQSQVQPLQLLPLTLDFSCSSAPFIVASSGSSSLRGLTQRCAFHRSTWGDYTTDYLRSAANFSTSCKLHILVHELKCTSTSAHSRGQQGSINVSMHKDLGLPRSVRVFPTFSDTSWGVPGYPFRNHADCTQAQSPWTPLL